MIAEDLINYMVPPLKVTDDITRAKQWMDEFRVKELPIVKEGQLLGFITEDMLYDDEILHPYVGDYPLVAQQCQVSSKKHYFEILKLHRTFNMDLVAVVDDSFKGIVLVQDILKELSKTAMVNSDGAIIILETTLQDYSLLEISRIIEMNEASILGLNMRGSEEEPEKIEVVIRLNAQVINEIINGLKTSGYKVSSTFNTEDKSFDEEERYRLLMKYLES